MLILLLLLYSVFGNVFQTADESTEPTVSKDSQNQSHFVTKLSQPCPDVGYFFRRDQTNSLPGAGACHLCFCKENNTAICWQREEKRCDVKFYRRFGKRDSRRRRSLPGDDESNIRIGKIKGKPCKPHDASFSEGCPPDDWCKGCTVCDCRDGRWDCHVLSFCPENEKIKKTKKSNSRRVYKMKGVTKANPSSNVKIDKPKKPASNVSPKDRILQREATRKMKQSKRRKMDAVHPAATPRGQTYRTTTRSRHRGRNPVAMRRLAESIRKELINNPIVNRKDKSNELLTKTTVQKQFTKKPLSKKSQTKKTIPSKQKQIFKKETTRMNSGRRSNTNPSTKNSKTYGSTKKMILQSTPSDKTTNLSKKTKSLVTIPSTKVTKTNPLTTKNVGKVTKLASTKTAIPNTTKAPEIKVSQKQLDQISTAIARTVMNRMEKVLNQQILTAPSKKKDAKVIKRSLVKKVNVAKNKKLTQLQANKTKSKNPKAVPKKLQKRSKINVDKSNKVRVSKRHKRDTNIWSTTDKSLDKVTIRETASAQNTIDRDYKTTIEMISSTTELPNAYYSYTVENFNRTTELVPRPESTNIIPLSFNNNTLESHDSENVTNLNVLYLKTANKTVTPIVLLDAKDITQTWSYVNINEVPPTQKIAVEYTYTKTTKNISEPTSTTITLGKKILAHKVKTNKERTIVTVPRKRKLNKVVSVIANKSMRLEDLNETAVTNNSRRTQFEPFKNFLHNLLSGFQQNNKTHTPPKKNKFKIIKYLKKFFKKLFNKIKNKGRPTNTTELPQLNKKSIIEALCESFGPCHISAKNKERLQRSIDILNSETFKMLKSIKIIKGLLKLLDFATNDRDIRDKSKLTTRTAFKHDIHKLHSILRGTYIKDEQLDRLTDTQKFQLEYVKNNTQSFIKSATRFALVLNDIINILTSVDTNNVTVHRRHDNTVTDDSIKVNIESGKNYTRVSRDVVNNKTILTGETFKHNKTHGDPFKKMRDLILKYNLLQNTFMKKIYKLIAGFDEVDVKQINKVVGRTANKASNVSDERLPNRTEAIRTCTKNIIKNLRKLKELIQRFNLSRRRKRELRDDDSLEYFLMLMEYLLKQNQPLDVSPVNDGIDLIIDAIKQSPDIKPIVKKVLDKTTTESSENKVLSEVNSSESLSDIKFSKEDIKFSKDGIKFSREDNSSSQGDDFKLGYPPKFTLNDPGIEEDEVEEGFVLNKRAKSFPTTTEMEYYMKDEHPTPAIEALVEGSSSTPNLPKELTPSIVFATSGEIVRQVDFEKDEKKDTGYKFDVFDGEVEEEVVVSSSTPSDVTEASDVTGESTTESTVTDWQSSTPSSKEKDDPVGFKRFFRDNEMRNLKADNSEGGDVSTSQSKSKLDWLEETYEEEVKGEVAGDGNRTKIDSTTKNNANPVKDNKNTRKKLNGIDNVSNISKNEEARRKKQGIEDIMYKKEMDLLNSLDYGTIEKSAKEGSNSKESGEDKYANDTFEGYVV